MHYLVKLLVEADNAEEALEKAQKDADTLVEMGQFDWYTFDGRWGTSEAYEADSEKGKEHIKQGMETSKREFTEAIAAIRFMFDNFTDEQIYEEDFPSYEEIKDRLPEGVYTLSRWQFGRVCANNNAPYLYSECSVVDSQRSLENQFKYAKQKLWVVPVDFHN